ncbi:Eukaryotic translation initiation factor 3 subunit D [Ranunculus cassubicifolius]
MAEIRNDVPRDQSYWGPPELRNHPYNHLFLPFNRSHKLGGVADFTRNRKPSDADDDSQFHLVDTKPSPRPKFAPTRRFHRPNPLPQRKDEEIVQKTSQKPKSLGNNWRNNQPRRESAVLKSSVDIQPEWNMLDQIPFSTFSKLSFSVPDPEDLVVSGAVEYYDKSYDRVNPKSARRLERFRDRSFFKVSTSDDPVIRRLAEEDKARVFATDGVLSTLMCAARSVYSWDIVVDRVGDKLFLDKRDGGPLDLVSVNETSQEALPEAKEDINSAYSLSVEAACINQNFSQQVLVRDGEKVDFEDPNPFASEGEKVASAAYRYRRWKLDDEMHLVARCEVQSVIDVNGEKSFMTLNALNEFDPKYSGTDWRKKLETQRGAVLATELKNNANKLAKWTAEALLANADVMKLGYVSRVHPRDPKNHEILSVVGYKPKEFAMQINLNTSNMWGIVKSIVDLCMKLDEGKYVLVKDPSKPQVRIYEVLADAFENTYVDEPLPEDQQVQATIGDMEEFVDEL